MSLNTNTQRSQRKACGPSAQNEVPSMLDFYATTYTRCLYRIISLRRSVVTSCELSSLSSVIYAIRGVFEMFSDSSQCFIIQRRYYYAAYYIHSIYNSTCINHSVLMSYAGIRLCYLTRVCMSWYCFAIIVYPEQYTSSL